MAEKRKDNKGRVLKENEAQRKDGSYQFRWRDRVGKRHYVYAKTVERHILHTFQPQINITGND